MIDDCGNCRFWGEMEGGLGECLRHAPSGPRTDDRWWPITLVDDWCGEHERKHSER
jgi:hypothetical protein